MSDTERGDDLSSACLLLKCPTPGPQLGSATQGEATKLREPTPTVCRVCISSKLQLEVQLGLDLNSLTSRCKWPRWRLNRCINLQQFFRLLCIHHFDDFKLCYSSI